MKVDISYGTEGLTVHIPDTNLVKVMRMGDKPVITNPSEETLKKLESPTGSKPLAELAGGKSSACIVISDITRPVPNTAILPPILKVLEESGIKRDAITILNGTGLHRPNEGEELVEVAGRQIVDNYRIENHHGQVLQEHSYLGDTPRGIPAWIDSRYVNADLNANSNPASRG